MHRRGQGSRESGFRIKEQEEFISFEEFCPLLDSIYLTTIFFCDVSQMDATKAFTAETRRTRRGRREKLHSNDIRYHNLQTRSSLITHYFFPLVTRHLSLVTVFD
jgi:hypothetical protein